MLFSTNHIQYKKVYADYESDVTYNSATMHPIRFFMLLLLVWSLAFFLVLAAMSRMVSFRNAVLEGLLPVKANNSPETDLLEHL